MDFTLGTDPLQRAVKALGVVVRTNSNDSDGHVLIEAVDNQVNFIANNGSTAIVFKADNAQVSSSGKTAVAFSKIKSFVMSFRSWNGETGAKQFRFVSDDRNIKISVNQSYEDGKFSKGGLKLPTFNPALISCPQPFNKPDFITNSSIFKTATNKVLYAINPKTDATYSALQGMNISFDEEGVCFVGCDGVVLSEYRVKNVTDKTEGFVNLQYDFFMGLRRLITDNTQLFWETGGSRVAVKFDNILFVGRTIVGQEYPEYKPALDNYTNYLSFSKEFLISALAPLQEVLDPEDHFRITIEIKDKVIRFYNDFANIETEQDIGSDINLCVDLNGKLLIQSIDAILDDNITFKFSNGTGPIILDSDTFNDQKALIQPLMKR